MLFREEHPRMYPLTLQILECVHAGRISAAETLMKDIKYVSEVIYLRSELIEYNLSVELDYVVGKLTIVNIPNW